LVRKEQTKKLKKFLKKVCKYAKVKYLKNILNLHKLDLTDLRYSNLENHILKIEKENNLLNTDVDAVSELIINFYFAEDLDEFIEF
jgi:hypothetical protein